ncbi:MAG: hypothetical protein QOH14_71 [Pseudonocardiales bacterium]|jgi:hypothetical protein|nr:hypothetical protein [Pseudonocardiales bacterium]
MRSSPWRFMGLVLADLAVLSRMPPDLPGLLHRLAAPYAWVTEVGADAAATTLCGALLWCVAAWLAVGLLALAAARVPGAGGRLARAASRTLLPRAVYRLAAGATGLGVLLAPVAAGAQPGGASTPAPAPTAGATLPAPSWPASNTPASSARASADGPQTDGTQPDAARVTVQAGDSLWRIAATRLGPDATSAEIADAWPHWYAANRAVIGADPALIRPGQVLSSPTEEGTAR